MAVIRGYILRVATDNRVFYTKCLLRALTFCLITHDYTLTNSKI